VLPDRFFPTSKTIVITGCITEALGGNAFSAPSKSLHRFRKPRMPFLLGQTPSLPSPELFMMDRVLSG
jgi:hypothetical protein